MVWTNQILHWVPHRRIHIQRTIIAVASHKKTWTDFAGKIDQSAPDFDLFPEKCAFLMCHCCFLKKAFQMSLLFLLRSLQAVAPFPMQCSSVWRCNKDGWNTPVMVEWRFGQILPYVPSGRFLSSDWDVMLMISAPCLVFNTVFSVHPPAIIYF